MGFILNALGAAAGAGADMLGEQRKSDMQLQQQRALAADTEARQMRLAEYNKKLDLEKQAAIEALRLKNIPAEQQAKTDAEDAAAQKRAGALKTAESGIVRRVMSERLAKDNITRDAEDIEQDEVDAELSRMTPEDRARVRKEAGLSTGQLNVKDAMADDAKGATRDLQSQIAEARQAAQIAKNQADHEAAMGRLAVLLEKAKAGGGDGNPTREERIRYTTLFTDAGRRLSEAQKALAKVMPGKAGDAEREQLQADIEQYKADRQLYQSMLAKSQAPDAGGTSKPADGGSGGPKRGDKRTVAAGPNKGKTAVFDGKGWVLQ